MARELVLLLGKNKSTFKILKIDRKKLYGYKKRISLDQDGNQCIRANLEEDTGLVFYNSDTSSCQIDHQGNYIEKSQLEAVDQNGKTVIKQDSTLGKAVDLKEWNEEEALNLKVNSVYSLEPMDFDKDLKSKLDEGKIFYFPFNYYSDFKLEDSALLKSNEGYFALIGRKSETQWIGEETNLVEDAETFDENDLDFEMM